MSLANHVSRVFGPSSWILLGCAFRSMQGGYGGGYGYGLPVLGLGNLRFAARKYTVCKPRDLRPGLASVTVPLRPRQQGYGYDPNMMYQQQQMWQQQQAYMAQQ